MAKDATGRGDGELLLSLVLPPVPSAVAEARRAVEACCPARVPCCWSLVLAASEMATNAVKHAGTSFRVELRRRAEGFHLAVTDFAPEQMPKLPRAPVDPLAQSGRGMGLVQQMATDWGVDQGPDTKSVWMLLACDPTRGEATAENQQPNRAGRGMMQRMVFA